MELENPKKTIIVAINTKYVHTSLAPWYLKASCAEYFLEVKVLEFNINDVIDNIQAVIYREKAKVVAFSCYIWNILRVLKICENIKKISPDSVIILGGPEVSFDSIEYMQENLFVDFIIKGEGESTFPKLLKHIFNDCIIEEINGLYYRKDNEIKFSGEGEYINELDSILSPYTDTYFENLNERVVYFEASRGCPFSCSYCISSTFDGVRFFSIERVLRELKKFMDKGIKQVKFVDRTFNCNNKRAISIFKFLIDNPSRTKFHFEIAADLFNDELMKIVATAPQGLFQFEIGLQTTNEIALEAVNRNTDMNNAFRNIKKLIIFGNIHIHLDLIAGMPFEDLISFRKSFNDVFSLRPNQVQLGFLKLLRGTMIRNECANHSYIFNSQPPYEVLYNKYISHDEILELKIVEEIVERYFNSARFVKSIEYISRACFENFYEFCRTFAKYNLDNGYLNRPISSREQYNVFNNFAILKLDINKYRVFSELLRFDYLCSDNTYNLPGSIKSIHCDGFRDLCFDFLNNRKNIEKYLEFYKEEPVKQIVKKVHFELFLYDVTEISINMDVVERKTIIIFDYRKRNPVSGLYTSIPVFKNDFIL